MALSQTLDDLEVDRFMQAVTVGAGLTIIEFTPRMADAAVAAFRIYGKGRGRPAKLNFGDCMAYAVAKVLALPLLHQGKAFTLTDIRSALG